MAKKQCKKSEKDKKINDSVIAFCRYRIDDIVFEKLKVNFEELPDDIPDFIKEEILQDLQQRIIAQHETFFVYLDNEINHKK